jgi:hypothetical protein
MSKTWVLDTETKGTGARMVPYEKTLSRRGRESELALVELGGEPKAPPAEARPQPARYKVVDVLGARVLAEGVDVRSAVRALEGARNVLDVSVYVWAPERHRWRLLTLAERKVLWGFRGRVSA